MKKIKAKKHETKSGEARKIPVKGTDQMATVDADDYPVVSQFPWRMGRNQHGKEDVITDVYDEEGKAHVMSMGEMVWKLMHMTKGQKSELNEIMEG